MKSNFGKSIFTGGKEREFVFQLTDYGSESESIYHITVLDDMGKSTTFRMKKDENGQWVIQAQVLHIWIHEAELELGDAIDEAL